MSSSAHSSWEELRSRVPSCSGTRKTSPADASLDREAIAAGRTENAETLRARLIAAIGSQVHRKVALPASRVQSYSVEGNFR